MRATQFPLERWPDVQANPTDYRLLERIPGADSLAFPVVLNEAVGDEMPLVVLDLETTGLSAGSDEIIELGMVRTLYSPSKMQITAITLASSLYEQPSQPIPELITGITGITDDMVAGHHIDASEIAQWFEDDPLVVAHHAAFDRPFFEDRFPEFKGMRWACSISEIPWKDHGYESNKLEYLLLKHGFFYSAHRASIDCMAVVWLLNSNTTALTDLITSAASDHVLIEAIGAPFDVKDCLKSEGYHWRPDTPKCWWKQVPEASVSEEQRFLDTLDRYGAEYALYTTLSARERYL